MDPWRDRAGPDLFPQALGEPREVLVLTARGHRVYECCCSAGEAQRFGVGNSLKVRVVTPAGEVLYEGRWSEMSP